MAGRSHGDGDGFLAQANFEGVFDGQQVLEGSGGVAFDFADRNCQNTPVHSGTRIACYTKLI